MKGFGREGSKKRARGPFTIGLKGSESLDSSEELEYSHEGKDKTLTDELELELERSSWNIKSGPEGALELLEMLIFISETELRSSESPMEASVEIVTMPIDLSESSKEEANEEAPS